MGECQENTTTTYRKVAMIGNIFTAGHLVNLLISDFKIFKKAVEAAFSLTAI